MIDNESGIEGQPFKYNAFISYSHTSDRQFAPIIRSALHQFARPWNKLRALNIFLDTSSLAGDPSLSGALEKALGSSEWLLFFASPASSKSQWVQLELKWWQH
jgi:TIR domain